MTYANFKTTVLSYVNRNSAVFTSGSLDYVLAAMNDARRAAQRDYTFNLNRTVGFVEVSLVGKSLLTDFDATPNGTAMVVKQVDAVYEYSTATVGGNTAYYRTARLPYYRQSQFERELPLAGGTFGVETSIAPQDILTNQMGFVYVQGTKIYHSRLTTPQWLMCDVVEILPDHDGGSSEDIFLTYFSDWLKYATILNMNQFLKEEYRFQIDMVFYNQLWESVKQFDAHQSAASGALIAD